MHADLSERPKIAEAPLSVILLAQPAARETDSIVQAWHDWLRQRGKTAEILLVGTWAESSDAPTLATGIQENAPHLRVIHQVAPPGEGPTLQSALLLAKHPLLLIAPADPQFQPADAQRLFEFIDKVDIVCGIRVDQPPPWWLRGCDVLKRVATKILLGYAAEPQAAWLGWRFWWRRFRARHIYGLKLRDPECVWRLVRAEVLRGLPIQSAGGFVHLEILAKLNHLGCWMTEVPVPWAPPAIAPTDPEGTADCWRMFREPEFGNPPPAPTRLPAGNAADNVIASTPVVEPQKP